MYHVIQKYCVCLRRLRIEMVLNRIIAVLVFAISVFVILLRAEFLLPFVNRWEKRCYRMGCELNSVYSRCLPKNEHTRKSYLGFTGLFK